MAHGTTHDDKLIGVAVHHIAAVHSGVLFVQARGEMRVGGGWGRGGAELQYNGPF